MRDIFFPIALVLLITILGFAHSLYLVPIFFSLLSIYFLIFDSDKLIQFYIILMPINNLIVKEDYLFGIVGIDLVLNISMIIYLLSTSNKVKIKNKLIEVTKSIIVLFLIYYPYISFKAVYFSLGDASLSYSIMRTINWVLKLFPLLLLLNMVVNKRIRKNIEFGIVKSAIFLGLLSVFNVFFISLGLYSTMAGTRINGFLNSGNANTLGGYFVLIIAYVIVRNMKSKLKVTDYVVVLLSFIVVAMSGSRASFISLITVLFLYMLHAKLSAKFFRMLIGIMIVAALVYPLFSTTLKRMTVVEQEQFEEHGTSNRYGKWVYYLGDIASNPQNIIRGTDHQLYINSHLRAAHNLYVTMLFEGGIIFPMLLILFIVRILLMRNKYGFDVLFFVFPLLFITMGNSEMGIFWMFFLFMSVLPYLGSENKSILKT